MPRMTRQASYAWYPAGRTRMGRRGDMAGRHRRITNAALGALLAICLINAGCYVCQPDPCLCASPIPRELAKVSMPEYVIEPPDILLIDAVRVIPLPPY